MAETNGLQESRHRKHGENEEKDSENLSMCTKIDKPKESESESVSKDRSEEKPKLKQIVHSESDRNLLLPLLRMDSLPQGDSSSNVPKHLPRTSSKDSKLPAQIMEASDPFLNPDMYKRYSICTDIEDTLHERIAKKMEMIKDVTRERAVDSITAGENAVYWLVNSLKYLTSGWFGLVILLLTIIVYGSLGALIFMFLEGPYEEEYKTRIGDVRKELADKIENIMNNKTMIMNNTDFLVLIEDDLVIYENRYSEYIKNVLNNDVKQKTWDFWNSFVFAGTIFTTIGYGNISPKTSSGRAATIVYGIIGIPLFLVVLASFGKFLTRIIKFFWAHISCSKKVLTAKRKAPVKAAKRDPDIEAVYRPSLMEDKTEEKVLPQIERKNETKADSPESPVIQIDEEFNLPTVLAIAILVIYMLFGAVVSHILESWSFLDSFYFVFISMSTIGLGDLVISNPLHMISSILYIIFGLSLTAMCIEVIQKNLTIMFRQACQKFRDLMQESDGILESTASEL